MEFQEQWPLYFIRDTRSQKENECGKDGNFMKRQLRNWEILLTLTFKDLYLVTRTGQYSLEQLNNLTTVASIWLFLVLVFSYLDTLWFQVCWSLVCTETDFQQYELRLTPVFDLLQLLTAWKSFSVHQHISWRSW